MALRPWPRINPTLPQAAQQYAIAPAPVTHRSRLASPHTRLVESRSAAKLNVLPLATGSPLGTSSPEPFSLDFDMVCHEIHSMSMRCGAVAAVLPHSAHAADAQELEEVVVTASPIGDADALATIAGSVDRNQLLRSGGGTLADALVDVPA